MNQPSARAAPAHQDEPEISLFALATVVLRWRKTVVVLSVLGGVLGLTIALTRPRLYMSSATFIPQRSEASISGIALAASQFGIRVPTSGDAWGPPLYVEVLRSQTLLEPIALDTMVLAEEGGRRVPLMDLLRVESSVPERRADLAVRALRVIVTANEVKTLGAVKVSVRTRWPSVSLTLAEQLLRAVNQFNVETRKSQAAAERQFVEGQAAEAERLLRATEDRLQVFLQRNRAFAGSPELNFEHDRLQREVALRQQVYTSLLQNREEAKMREVRDTPVITVLENPRLPVVNEARGALQRGVLGGLVGGMLSVMIAFLADAARRARRESGEAGGEFFLLLEEATPRWLRRRGR